MAEIVSDVVVDKNGAYSAQVSFSKEEIPPVSKCKITPDVWTRPESTDDRGMLVAALAQSKSNAWISIPHEIQQFHCKDCDLLVFTYHDDDHRATLEEAAMHLQNLMAADSIRIYWLTLPATYSSVSMLSAEQMRAAGWVRAEEQVDGCHHTSRFKRCGDVA